MNRGFRSQNTTNSTEQPVASQPGGVEPKKHEKHGNKHVSSSMNNLKKAGSLTFLLALLIIVAGVIFAMINFRGNNESKYVDTSKYQAVFLNGGQVYFGNVSDLNSKYLTLNNIFYLRVNQQVQPNSQSSSNNDVSLVKLGCELHGPQNQMVINRDQVIFWENIKDDGQVVKAINEYAKQYPNGEDCNNQANSNNSTNTSTPATNSTTTPTTTTNKNN